MVGIFIFLFVILFCLLVFSHFTSIICIIVVTPIVLFSFHPQLQLIVTLVWLRISLTNSSPKTHK